MSEEHGGVICIDTKNWHEMLKKRLLLPDTYTVHAIFYTWMRRQWEIVVEGPDLPALTENVELPQITPIYQRNADGSTSLVRIQEVPTGAILFDHILTADEYAAEVKQRMEANR